MKKRKRVIQLETEVDRNLKPIENGMLVGRYTMLFKFLPNSDKKEIADIISKTIIEQAELESIRIKNGEFELMINGRIIDE